MHALYHFRKESATRWSHYRRQLEFVSKQFIIRRPLTRIQAYQPTKSIFWTASVQHCSNIFGILDLEKLLVSIAVSDLEQLLNTTDESYHFLICVWAIYINQDHLSIIFHLDAPWLISCEIQNTLSRTWNQSLPTLNSINLAHL